MAYKFKYNERPRSYSEEKSMEMRIFPLPRQCGIPQWKKGMTRL